MTKVLFFMHLSPPIHGVTVCNDMLANSQLIESSIDSRVLPIRYSSTIEGMQSHGVAKVMIMFNIFMRLLAELVFHRPHVVYFTISPLGAAFIRDIVFVLLIKLFRVKLIYHLHGKGINLIVCEIKKSLYRFVFQNSIVICMSELLAKDIASVSSNAKVVICPNGIDFDVQKRKEIVGKKQLLVEGGRSINVLFLSNLSRVKGVDLYLDMVSDILRDTDDINFHIAGPFSNVFTLLDYEKFIQRNPHVKGSLIYHGAVYEEEKWSLLSNMDVLVHPTRNDAFPLVILEAMAVGCVIISTDQGGIPDMLNGLEGSSVVEIGGFVSALLQLKNNKKNLSLYAECSFQKFDEKYSKNIFERNILDVVNVRSKGGK